MLKLSNLKIILIFPFYVICSRYNYLLFENFELTKNGFMEEQEVVRNLQKSRRELRIQIQILNSTINHHAWNNCFNNEAKLRERRKDITKFHLQIIKRYIIDKNMFLLNKSYIRRNVLNANQKYSYDYVKNFSEIEIIDGAMKGVIMLHETYNQNIKDYSKGNLRLKNGITRTSRNIDSLNLDDLAHMSNIAFNHFKWYDTGLKYLKESIDLFYSLLKDDRKKFPGNLEEYFTMKKNYWTVYHNSIFNKTSNIIGPDWKVFPYMVDPGDIYK